MRQNPWSAADQRNLWSFGNQLMKSQYFLAGNLWLMLGLLAVVSCEKERSFPDMYSLFGAGRFLWPGECLTYIGVIFIAAVVCFVLFVRDEKPKS